MTRKTSFAEDCFIEDYLAFNPEHEELLHLCYQTAQLWTAQAIVQQKFFHWAPRDVLAVMEPHNFIWPETDIDRALRGL